MSSSIKTKIVNIKATIPVRDVTPPISGTRTNIKMTLSDILKCLCRRAIVEQVLSDGSTVRLTTKNFRDDFEAKLQEDIAKKVEAEKKAEEDENASHTGELEDDDLLSKIDDDPDPDLDNGPEEAANVVVDTKVFLDGKTVIVTGIEPGEENICPTDDMPDVIEEQEEPTSEPDPEELNNDAAETETITSGYIQIDVKETPVESVTVNTITDAPDTTAVTRKNTSKKSTYKKKK